MVFKNFGVPVLWTKVASALGGLRLTSTGQQTWSRYTGVKSEMYIN